MKRRDYTKDMLLNRIGAARGGIAPDLVLKGGRVVNVFTHELIEADVAIYDGTIVGIGSYEGKSCIDARGDYISPGFIDGHLHTESTMLSVPELAKALLPYGTTAVIADPHEIANVMGRKGIRYIIESSQGLPVDFYITLPSCVPASPLESSGAVLTADDLKSMKGEDRILGLAEMMNYPGVVAGEDGVLEKIAAFPDMIKDGHAPLLSGKELNAYITAGLLSDHECTALSEALEKLRLGMHVMIREGTQAKNLRTLIPIVSPATVTRCSLVTDDIHPHDLLHRGHLNYLIDLATGEGIDPLLAIVMVTHSTALYFGLANLGAVAPGYTADIAVLSSLKPLEVKTVIKNGSVVYDKGVLTAQLPQPVLAECPSQMNIRAFDPGSFVIPKRGEFIRVIGLIPGQILTKGVTRKAPLEGGAVMSDAAQDLIKIAVIERHRGTGNIGLGMVEGFGLKKGALASTVAHDSHNLITVGCNDRDMFVAAKAVEKMGGGLAAVRDGEVTAELPLPIAGLMSYEPLGKVAHGWEKLKKASRGLGCTLPDPFMALSFLALSVIPELKITDRGLVDVREFRRVPLFV
ncbi:MAG TPA: adenine deaminase [Syntrophales bacterium]|nr:adenine deaminase [Syntrophales bacterium]